MSSDKVAGNYTALGRTLVSGEEACPVCHESTLRVGTDVQRIEAVVVALEQHADRYLNRVYTSQEVDTALGGTGERNVSGVASLAARYAVKEAVIKVLRPVQTAVPWAEIEVVRQSGGWCTLALYGVAEQLAERAGLSQWAISFAHDGGFAVATVIARHECGHPHPA